MLSASLALTERGLGRLPPTAETVSTRDRWMELRAGWDRLGASSPDDCPMLTHEWFTVFIDNFAPTRELRVATIFEGEELIAAAPLSVERRRSFGLPHTALVSLANVHSQRFDLLARDPEALEALWRRLRATPGWDVLELRDIPEGGVGERLAALARRDGWLTGRWESMQTPFVPLAEPPEVTGKLRQNLRRRLRHLEEVGAVELLRCEGGPALDGFLERGLALEAAGWKGERGTAIACDPATRGFYRELAHEAARQGWLRLYGLGCGEELAAFHFGLAYRGRYFLPKPAYDELLRACSPGQLLLDRVLRQCREDGLREFDFLGPSMPWKRDWTALSRPHAWHFIYRPGPMGTALHGLKVRFTPFAKRWARRAQAGFSWMR